MSGIFDRLQKQLDIRKRESGISPIDLVDLPPNLRRIMRLMLREVVMRYDDLVEAVEGMPEAQRLSRDELDAALEKLVEQNWLQKYEGEFTSYRVNLRRREGSQIGKDIWSALGDVIGEEQKGGASEEQSGEG